MTQLLQGNVVAIFELENAPLYFVWADYTVTVNNHSASS